MFIALVLATVFVIITIIIAVDFFCVKAVSPTRRAFFQHNCNFTPQNGVIPKCFFVNLLENMFAEI